MPFDAAVTDWHKLAADIKVWSKELGFSALSIAPAAELKAAAEGLERWLAAGYHGEMEYMVRHAAMRLRPRALLADATSVLCVRLDYWPARALAAKLVGSDTAYLSRYALGRDYHKVARGKLKTLAGRIEAAIGPFSHRACCDSAPLAEVAYAAASGLGWRGKHTLLLSRHSGSKFFLGCLLTNLPLPFDAKGEEHCGSCRACLDACPTGAIVAPYRVDARRCISYLTIELKGSIPVELRPLIGNRVYGCDDCQLCCPWNRQAPASTDQSFAVRHGLDATQLTELFAWSAEEFERRLAGSAIRRIGYERWLRNLAVGLGNAPSTPAVLAALASRQNEQSDLVREHVAWALAEHAKRLLKNNR